jgi:UDP-glucose 4-epimerase
LLQAAARTVVPLEFAPRRAGEQQESYVDVNKAREVLGWAPEVDLADGLARTYNWFARETNGARV